ncbi:MAG: GNAT family N-acetyltransferase, partial [Thermohalobaculum sp.]|nr:GNAT family N-acetyltransferase [Thermohalobaculum sp.]
GGPGLSAGLRIRAFAPGDAADCHRVFWRAVHEGAVAAYSTAERAAWAPDPDPPPDWGSRLGDGITLVAIRKAAIRGFMTLGHDGHLDLAYVLPEERGQGTADALLAALEAAARARGLHWLTTEASLVARPFLERHGWCGASRQSVIRNGVALTNFRMHKPLGTSDA